MFDIGFQELLLVAIVALLVLGPERLPQALRTLGLWIGRMRRSFNAVKNEIEREIGMDEIRRQLHNEAVMEELKRIERDVRSTVNEAARPQADAQPAATELQMGAPREAAPGANPEPQPQPQPRVIGTVRPVDTSTQTMSPPAAPVPAEHPDPGISGSPTAPRSAIAASGGSKPSGTKQDG